MIPAISSATAIAFLILVLILFRRNQSKEPTGTLNDVQICRKLEHGGWLHLSERIFDPVDAQWLGEELSLPRLAEALTLSRKRLAICWLEALQSSFDEFVRTPQYLLGEEFGTTSAEGWQMLWFSLRFKISLSYALLIVKWFGPYHRLIPTFSWVPFSQKSERSFRRTSLANSRSAR